MDELLTAFKSMSDDYLKNDRALLALVETCIERMKQTSEILVSLSESIDFLTQRSVDLEKKVEILRDLHRLDEVE